MLTSDLWPRVGPLCVQKAAGKTDVVHLCGAVIEWTTEKSSRKNVFQVTNRLKPLVFSMDHFCSRWRAELILFQQHRKKSGWLFLYDLLVFSGSKVTSWRLLRSGRDHSRRAETPDGCLVVLYVLKQWLDLGELFLYWLQHSTFHPDLSFFFSCQYFYSPHSSFSSAPDHNEHRKWVPPPGWQ